MANTSSGYGEATEGVLKESQAAALERAYANVATNIAIQVRTAREQQAMTVAADLARRVGTATARTIARIESGERVTKISTLVDVATALGKRLDIELVDQ